MDQKEHERLLRYISYLQEKLDFVHWAYNRYDKWCDFNDSEDSTYILKIIRNHVDLPVIVQTKNPRTQRYVKIDRVNAIIKSHKKSPGPYKNIRIIKK